MSESLKILSLAIALIGIIILILMLNFSSPIKVSSIEDLEALEDGTKIQVEGTVAKQTSSSIKLDNNFTLDCENCPSYLNQTIKAEAFIDKYNNRIYLKTLKITKLS
ncbi:MAG: hypothetical protein QXD13_00115 [Candidatus Pacearchaeota archaeon]